MMWIVMCRRTIRLAFAAVAATTLSGGMAATQTAQLPPRGEDRLPNPAADHLPDRGSNRLPPASAVELSPRAGRLANPTATTRTVIAAAMLPDVTGAPLHLHAVIMMLPPGTRTDVAAADGFVYVLTGPLDMAIAGAVKALRAGEGAFVPAGSGASFAASANASATFLHFLLAASLERPVATAPAVATELYRTPALPRLKPGPYAADLVRVMFPIRMPANSPQHRTGAALSYVLGGTGVLTVDGKTTREPPQSLVYEPFGLVHQWANPGGEALILLVFNINPAGIGAIRSGAPEIDE
jgi:quercetin dioxygenase-like cupin family protein